MSFYFFKFNTYHYSLLFHYADCWWTDYGTSFVLDTRFPYLLSKKLSIIHIGNYSICEPVKGEKLSFASWNE